MSFLTEVKQYAVLTPEELEEVCKFRNRVYLAEGLLVEEVFSTARESPHLPDTTDKDSVHFIVRNWQREVVAYSRLILSKTPPEVGRFCVHQDYRGHTKGDEPVFLLFAIMAKYSLKHHIPNWQCLIRCEFFYLCKKILNLDIKTIGDKIFYSGCYLYPSEINVITTLHQNNSNPRSHIVSEMISLPYSACN